MPQNTSESKINIHIIPLKLEQISKQRSEEELKNIESIQKPKFKNQEESRNSSLVILNTKERMKNIAKSRPKQRRIKLIEENDRVSSVLKILTASDKLTQKTERSKSKILRYPNIVTIEKPHFVPNLRKPSIPRADKIYVSLLPDKQRMQNKKRILDK